MTERRHMPDERHGHTDRLVILGEKIIEYCPHCGGVVKVKDTSCKGYVTTNAFNDGTPGEVFVMLAQQTGETRRGLMSCLALSWSLCLQFGVPFKLLYEKFAGQKFEPFGYVTGCEGVKQTKSIVDLIFQWLATKYPNELKQKEGDGHE